MWEDGNCMMIFPVSSHSGIQDATRRPHFWAAEALTHTVPSPRPRIAPGLKSPHPQVLNTRIAF